MSSWTSNWAGSMATRSSWPEHRIWEIHYNRDLILGRRDRWGLRYRIGPHDARRKVDVKIAFTQFCGRLPQALIESPIEPAQLLVQPTSKSHAPGVLCSALTSV